MCLNPLGSTACLSHSRDQREIKVVFRHTCSLHTCICAWGTLEASTPTGSCRRGNATLLGVSQVTLFCLGLCRTVMNRVNHQPGCPDPLFLPWKHGPIQIRIPRIVTKEYSVHRKKLFDIPVPSRDVTY